jgi:hypothetical protein
MTIPPCQFADKKPTDLKTTWSKNCARRIIRRSKINRTYSPWSTH